MLYTSDADGAAGHDAWSPMGSGGFWLLQLPAIMLRPTSAEASVVVVRRQQRPAHVLLASDIGLDRFALRWRELKSWFKPSSVDSRV